MDEAIFQAVAAQIARAWHAAMQDDDSPAYTNLPADPAPPLTADAIDAMLKQWQKRLHASPPPTPWPSSDPLVPPVDPNRIFNIPSRIFNGGPGANGPLRGASLPHLIAGYNSDPSSPGWDIAPVEPAPYEGPVGTRHWAARAGKFEIVGWTGEVRDIAGTSFDRFVLPAGEQVPCLNVNDYQCEHWITQGWWDDNQRLVLCVTCADHRSDSCGY